MANLTFDELRDIFGKLTFIIKGLDYNSKDGEIQKLVREAYQENSQPFNGIDDDTTYYFLSIRDDETNELWEKSNRYDSISDEIKSLRSQNRVLEVVFTFYGNHSFDTSQQARARLMQKEAKNFLDSNGIYLVRPIGGVNPTYEAIEGRNWKRADFSALFNNSYEIEESLEIFEHLPLAVNSLETIIIGEE